MALLGNDESYGRPQRVVGYGHVVGYGTLQIPGIVGYGMLTSFWNFPFFVGYGCRVRQADRIILCDVISSYYHSIIVSYYHIIIRSQREMVAVVFGAKSRFSTHIESLTPSPRKSPQK